jgi:DNA-binding CsgD family transcriptional regulator
MGKSGLLRVQEVQSAYRLIGECRDLGSDPALWQRRMVDGFRRLIGVPAVAGGEGRWTRPRGGAAAISAFDAGFDSSGRELYRAYLRELGPRDKPIFEALRHVPGRVVTRTRREIIADATWYRSVVWNEYRRPMKIDDQLTSVYRIPGTETISVIALHRGLGERAFSPREHRLLSLFHEELGRLIGRSLVSAQEPSPDKLSPRLRQTLACLVEGDTEKQVAARLGLSQTTTHQYVMALYRHFGVTSRAQLLAHMIKRIGRRGSTGHPAGGAGVSPDP